MRRQVELSHYDLGRSSNPIQDFHYGPFPEMGMGKIGAGFGGILYRAILRPAARPTTGFILGWPGAGRSL